MPKKKEKKLKKTLEPEKIEKKIVNKDIFSKLDQIDEKTLAESQLEAARVAVIHKKKVEETQSKEEKLSILAIQKKIDDLKEIKQRYLEADGFEDAIKTAKEMIEFAKRASIKHVIEEEEQSIKDIQKEMKTKKVVRQNEIKEEIVEEKKRDIFSKLDSIDSSSVEESRLESIRLAEVQREKKQKKVEKLPEMQKLSIGELQRKISELQKVKKALHDNKDFLNAILTSEDIIEIAKQANITTTIEKQEKYIIEAKKQIPSLAGILDEINSLKRVRQNNSAKDNYKQAIKATNKIIELATKENIKLIIDREKHILQRLEEKAEMIASKPVEAEAEPTSSYDKLIEKLRMIEKTHVEEKNYLEAIETAYKIIKIATDSKAEFLKSVIKEEKQFINLMEEKAKVDSNKAEIMEQIEDLKIKKKEHSNKKELESALEISKKILTLAKIAEIDVVIEEQTNSIEFLREKITKEKSISDFENEHKTANLKFENLVDQGKYDAAHKIVLDFQEIYGDNEQPTIIEAVQKLILKEKKIQLTRESKQTETPEEPPSQPVISQPVSTPQPEMTDVQLDGEELIEAKQSFEQVKLVLEAQKIELEKEYEILEQEKAELAEVKKNFEQVKYILEEQKLELEKEWEKLELQKARFAEQRRTFDKQLGAQLADRDEIVIQVRDQLEADREEFQKEVEQFNKDKKELEEKKKKILEIL